MADNSRKTPFQISVPANAHDQAANQINLTGKALPCSVVSVSGQIVTVKFEIQSTFTLPNVTVPIATWQYIRIPVQVGEKGVVLPADAYLGGVSGIGGGTADLSRRGNLTPLVFVPVSNKAWSAEDGNILVLMGPNGVTIQDAGGNDVVKITKTDITITVPNGQHVKITSGGTAQAVKLADGSSSTVLMAQ